MFFPGWRLLRRNFPPRIPALTDPDVLDALHALAETYKTLGSGILYEKPPDATLPRELYAALAAIPERIQAATKLNARLPPPAKDSEVFTLLVFLYRMGLLRTNGRASRSTLHRIPSRAVPCRS